MNCKFCNAVLAEDMTVCPACGKAQEATELTEETVAVEETPVEETPVEEAPVEETPAQETVAEAAPAKANTKKLTAAIIAIVLVAGILIGMVLGGLGKQPAATPVETEPAEEILEIEPVMIPADGDPASPLCKASYTVSDEEAVAAKDVVIATMGDKTLTNGQLQAYYWQEIYMFLQENSSYAQYLGMDFYQPLDQQILDMGDVIMSWQQFFLDGAIQTWKNYQALALEGEENGHQLEAERQEELDSMAQEMEEGAILRGMSGADEMINMNVGANCNLSDYMTYATTYYNGMSYYQAFCDSLNPTTEELEAFYAENEDYFISSGLGKEDKLINVRHVLLVPEGTGETGEDGYLLYTEEAWEACRVKAEELYNKWLEGDKSEESFATLAMENSVDGSASVGGLYEDVYKGRMVENFDNWCFDESRQVGDHGLVKTQYGYHIMFYCGDRNWEYYARDEWISEVAYAKIPEVVAKFAAEVDFSKVALCDIPLA